MTGTPAAPSGHDRWRVRRDPRTGDHHRRARDAGQVVPADLRVDAAVRSAFATDSIAGVFSLSDAYTVACLARSRRDAASPLRASPMTATSPCRQESGIIEV